MARDEGKAAPLRDRGYEVRIADYSDAASMERAFAGVDRLLFVSTPVQGLSANVVDAAKAAGVGFVAYTSIFGVDRNKGRLEVNHAQTESLVGESGIPHAFLRDSWYLEVLADFLAWAAESGEFPYFAGEGAMSYVLKREYAEAGARVVTGGGFSGALDFANAPVTFAQIGALVSEAVGRPVRVERVTREEFETRMEKAPISRMGAQLATLYQDLTFALDACEEGSTPDVLEGVLGRAVTPYAEAVREVIEAAKAR